MTLLEELRESGLCYDDKCFKDKSEYVIDIFEKWLKWKHEKIIEGCDNPHCPFCLDVKEKKGMVDYIFDGYLIGDGNRKEVNPTWTKRARKIYAVCKHAKEIATNGEQFNDTEGMQK